MTSSSHTGTPAAVAALGAVTSVVLLVAALPIAPAYAAQAPAGLGTVGSYCVLGGQTVTNIGPTTVNAISE